MCNPSFLEADGLDAEGSNVGAVIAGICVQANAVATRGDDGTRLFREARSCP